jgi:hypothetical protein
MMTFPTEWETTNMFQTTNQVYDQLITKLIKLMILPVEQKMKIVAVTTAMLQPPCPWRNALDKSDWQTWPFQPLPDLKKLGPANLQRNPCSISPRIVLI